MVKRGESQLVELMKVDEEGWRRGRRVLGVGIGSSSACDLVSKGGNDFHIAQSGKCANLLANPRGEKGQETKEGQTFRNLQGQHSRKTTLASWQCSKAIFRSSRVLV